MATPRSELNILDECVPGVAQGGGTSDDGVKRFAEQIITLSGEALPQAATQPSELIILSECVGEDARVAKWGGDDSVIRVAASTTEKIATAECTPSGTIQAIRQEQRCGDRCWKSVSVDWDEPCGAHCAMQANHAGTCHCGGTHHHDDPRPATTSASWQQKKGKWKRVCPRPKAGRPKAAAKAARGEVVRVRSPKPLAACRPASWRWIREYQAQAADPVPVAGRPCWADLNDDDDDVLVGVACEASVEKRDSVVGSSTVCDTDDAVLEVEGQETSPAELEPRQEGSDAVAKEDAADDTGFGVTARAARNKRNATRRKEKRHAASLTRSAAEAAKAAASDGENFECCVCNGQGPDDGDGPQPADSLGQCQDCTFGAAEYFVLKNPRWTSRHRLIGKLVEQANCKTEDQSPEQKAALAKLGRLLAPHVY